MVSGLFLCGLGKNIPNKIMTGKSKNRLKSLNSYGNIKTSLLLYYRYPLRYQESILKILDHDF